MLGECFPWGHFLFWSPLQTGETPVERQFYFWTQQLLADVISKFCLRTKQLLFIYFFIYSSLYLYVIMSQKFVDTFSFLPGNILNQIHQLSKQIFSNAAIGHLEANFLPLWNGGKGDGERLPSSSPQQQSSHSLTSPHQPPPQGPSSPCLKCVLCQNLVPWTKFGSC